MNNYEIYIANDDTVLDINVLPHLSFMFLRVCGCVLVSKRACARPTRPFMNGRSKRALF